MKKVWLFILTVCLTLTVGAACAISGQREEVVFNVEPVVYSETWDSASPADAGEGTVSSASFALKDASYDVRFIKSPGLRFNLSFGTGASVASVLPDDATDIYYGAAIVPVSDL